jgi:hypothetical protein
LLILGLKINEMRETFRNFFIALFLANVAPALGQDINTLEEKNGFKIFKINSEKINYINNLDLIQSTTELNTYNYNKFDSELFDLFGNKINSIHLIFDNSTNKLKKINLDISKEYSVNYLNVLGWQLKKLYLNFEEIIGHTTEIKKPGKDCQNPNTSCLFFEDLIFDGKILWESKSIILKITHKVDHKIKNDGNVVLIVSENIIFSDKDIYIKEKNSKF